MVDLLLLLSFLKSIKTIMKFFIQTILSLICKFNFNIKYLKKTSLKYIENTNSKLCGVYRYVSLFLVVSSIFNVSIAQTTVCFNIESETEEEVNTGTMSTSSSDLELGEDEGNSRLVGLRYASFNLPGNAVVTNATIQFTANEVSNTTASLIIKGELTDNAVPYSSSNFNVSNRATTIASVNWQPPQWSSIGEIASAQKTPNISNVINEIVANSNFTSGNAISFIISGTGTRTAENAPIDLCLTYITCGSPGETCNDNLDCTANDLWDSNCNCLGTPDADADNDGTCDAEDQCPNFDNNLIGTFCNDNNSNTINDLWQSNCNCAGTLKILINEVFLSGFNGSEVDDHGFKVDDWIEIYNPTNSVINLSGWYLSDNKDEPTKWRIPSGNISAKNYRVFNANGLDDSNTNTNFKIDQSELNEEVVLTDPSGSIVDVYKIRAYTQIGHSRGRDSNGSNSFVVFSNPTKNAANNNGTNYAPSPMLSIPSGAHNGPVSLVIDVPAGFTARYELNTGNNSTARVLDPISTSTIYNSPISINNTTVIKVRLFDNAGILLPGFVETNTYLINENHNLYTLSVSGKNNIITLLEGQINLYPTAHWEFFNESGDLVTEVSGNLNKHGQDSWVYDQRGFDIFARDEAGYGGQMKHQFFENRDRDEFDRFIIRAAGDDNYPFESGGAHIRDAFIQTWGYNSGLEMDHRTYKPCVVYVNGKYWGVYEIREKVVHKSYTKHYFNQDEDDLDYLSYWDERTVRYGSGDEWDALITYINSNNMGNASNFEYVNSQVNLTSWTDYAIFNSYIVSKDWNNYNSAWWRGRNPNGGAQKWQFILWDMDASFGHYINYSNVPNITPNASPCDVLDDSPIYDPEKLLSSFEKILDQNSAFKNFVANRYNDLLNTYWSCDYSIPLLNTMVSEKSPEMPRQFSRWRGNLNTWQNNVEDIRDFLNDRCDAIDSKLASCLNLGAKYQVTLNTQPANLDCAGIRVNTVSVPYLPMTGDYYGNLPVDLIANDSYNYEFSHWTNNNGTINNNTRADSIRVSFMHNENLTAHFNYVGAGKELVINEIHYNPADSILANGDTISGKSFEFVELKNIGADPIDLQGLYFGKGIEERFNSSNIIQPGDFVVLAEDSAMFHSKYGFAADYKYNGKLENNGEKIWLNDICGNIIDSLRYDDNLPWDTIPDNGQYSLALIDVALDNSNPSNWSAQAIPATPGAENDFCVPIHTNSQTANISCFGENDGLIITNITGGTAPFNYNWNNGSTETILQNLSVGTYILTINDFYNCTKVDSFTIDEPNPLTATYNITNDNSNSSNDGLIDLILDAGGTPPYTFEWSNGVITEDLNNIAAGTYSVTITDANGCKLIFDNLVVESNCLIFITQQNYPVLNSKTYQVADFIESNGVVQTNENVIFKANNYVELTNDFEVKPGAEFEAKIDGCD